MHGEKGDLPHKELLGPNCQSSKNEKPWPITLARFSSTMLNRSGNGVFLLVAILKGRLSASHY
jgi:hypothetical protein